MPSVSWLIKRLKAMSIPEVAWRLSQKRIEKREQASFKGKRRQAVSAVFNPALAGLIPDADRLHLNFGNAAFSCNTAIHLLSGADYGKYKKRWDAGFQTENAWPDAFSYELEYKQRDEIGDARTNWELNRHFQFALLAKDYAASGDARYLRELEDLFRDWNEKNPFLHGISWTSVMEAAIRCVNWIYAYGFLARADAPEKLLNELKTGILNMTEYIANHYSRYSSANNHLIVEACAIGHSGILFGHQPWIDLAVNILTRELPLQNEPDGVNKEQSLHYQSFYMEAMGLMLRLLKKNSLAVPASWPDMLDKMCRYVADCMGDYGEIVVFGDDDEGKILDLAGISGPDAVYDHTCHYRYVLGMLSLLLDRQYTDIKKLDCETLRWLFTGDEWERAAGKEKYIPPQYCCYRQGGNTILRSADRKLLIGVDHAALGFGSICAHGHADALSFQAYYAGAPVFIDPGTGIYHCDLPRRNAFRETRNHNTVCVGGKNQSEMLGAFLWGAKAQAALEDYREENGGAALVMTQNGYRPVIHTRILRFDGRRTLTITDELSQEAEAEANLLFAPGLAASFGEQSVTLRGQGFQAEVRFSGGSPRQTLRECSGTYGTWEPTESAAVPFTQKLTAEIVFQDAVQ